MQLELEVELLDVLVELLLVEVAVVELVDVLIVLVVEEDVDVVDC